MLDDFLFKNTYDISLYSETLDFAIYVYNYRLVCPIP